MNAQMKLCAALLGGALLVGCGEDTDDTTPTAPPPGSTPTAPQATGDTSESMSADAQSAADKAAQQAQSGVDAAGAGAQQAAGELKTGGQDAASAATAAAGDASAQASTQIQQVMTYIKENKLDLAETTLQQLEKNKASLPTAIQPQVDRARQMLDAAKAGQSGAAPSLPSTPTTPAPAPAQ